MVNRHLNKIITALVFSYLPSSLVSAATLGSSWPTNSVLLHIGLLKGEDNIWVEAFEEGAKRWNDTPTSFEFRTSDNIGIGICSRTGDNAVQFSPTFCGESWGSGTLAITRVWSTGTTTTKTDIIFNTNKDWSVYDGPDQSFANDFRRVAIHEMGHSAGLDHPEATDVIMSAFSNDAFLPALDDINSLRGVYGGGATHTLTIQNDGDGVVSITPHVDGTGVLEDNVLYTSDYGDFLDCNDALCQIPIQDGLRLDIKAIPNEANGVEFDGWSGTSIQSSSVQLAPLENDRTLTAHFSVGFDADEDGVADHVDNCPSVKNNDQTNTDGDDAGDACDAFINDPTETLDSDNDNVGDNTDNCPDTPNEDQVDTDEDGAGNQCDSDDDNDGVQDNDDAFPLDADESIDTDNDGIGNNADTDDDNDGTEDKDDKFPLDKTESLDTDNDGIGNNADNDDDNDGVQDNDDDLPLDANESVDTDGDGIGNNADSDDDNDGVSDRNDRFPLNANESVDTDNDGIGNNSDPDDDNDGVNDENDRFPLSTNESIDTDNDGIGNNSDTDDDNDGVPDVNDRFPLNVNESVDTDNDGIGNNSDSDDDNDGVPDENDRFPLNANESVDTDNDGIGNNSDLDDDNDGVQDDEDDFPLDANKSDDTGNQDTDNQDTDNQDANNNADNSSSDPNNTDAPASNSSGSGAFWLIELLLFSLIGFIRKRFWL